MFCVICGLTFISYIHCWLFHLWGVCIRCTTDLDASTLACLRRLLNHHDEEDGVLANDDGTDDDLVDGEDDSDGDVYLCDSELRGILDQQKNNH